MNKLFVIKHTQFDVRENYKPTIQRSRNNRFECRKYIRNTVHDMWALIYLYIMNVLYRTLCTCNILGTYNIYYIL